LNDSNLTAENSGKKSIKKKIQVILFVSIF
jgi:hypothetical protein